MDKKLALKLIPLVNNSSAFDGLLEYLDMRAEKLKDGLLYATTLEELKAVQMTITELRRLKGLREETTSVLERKD